LFEEFPPLKRNKLARLTAFAFNVQALQRIYAAFSPTSSLLMVFLIRIYFPHFMPFLPAKELGKSGLHFA